jgi:hypothetical protein
MTSSIQRRPPESKHNVPSKMYFGGRRFADLASERDGKVPDLVLRTAKRRELNLT